MPSLPASPHARRAIIAIGVLAAIGAYWWTAFPTISWWENGELIAAAGVLGVVHPPGALIPTIVGWLALRIPFASSPAHWLNLVAGIVAGMTVLIIFIAARRLWTLHPVSHELHPPDSGYMVVGALAALGFAFSRTFWSNGTLYTPYVFTALLTSAIFFALLSWWRNAERESVWRWTFVVMLLMGLDFSVHRTNLLLLPGVVLWFLLRHPSLFRRWRLWMAGAGGLALGLSVQLLLIPMARRMPPLNSNNPATIGGLWDYVSLKQYGGGFLVDLLPRKGDFWTVQVADYVRGFAASFATLDGPLGPLGLVPLLMGLFGIIMLWRRSARLAIGALVLFALTSIGAIVYFNLPANYFRAMDRHYLPSFVLFAVFMAYGAVSLAMIANRHRARIVVLSAGALVVAGVAAQVTRNWPELDHSRTYFAFDFGRNLLASLPQQSIVITGTDVDTYPIWYLQMVEKQRPDVSVANVSLLNTPWYLTQVLAAKPSFGLTMSPDEIATHGFRAWRDTTLAIPTAGWTDPTGQGTLPDTLFLRVPPTAQGKYIFGHDDVVMRMITANHWQRPIYFTSFALQQLGWLTPYLRPEGLVHRLMPVDRPAPDTTLLIANLITNYSSRGYADSSITLEPPSRWVAQATYSAFFSLAQAETDRTRCQDLKARLLAAIPLERIGAPEELVKGLAATCVSSPTQPR